MYMCRTTRAVVERRHMWIDDRCIATVGYEFGIVLGKKPHKLYIPVDECHVHVAIITTRT